MSKKLSTSDYVKYFLAGCLLAALGLGAYTLLADSSQEPDAQATAAPAQAAPNQAATQAPVGEAPGGEAPGREAPGREAPSGATATALPVVTVYKSPTCGCCAEWAEHMQAAGFEVKTVDQADVTPKKNDLGVPMGARSCHTATVGDYAIEGHVPAGDVKRLLAEEPDVAGLAVPGMPIGSPGMEMPGRAQQSYQVYAFSGGRATGVFAQH
jgi:hypothetical protein